MPNRIINSILRGDSNFRDLFIFVYDFSVMDLDLFIILLKSGTPKTLDELAREVDRDKSTVFRSLQKMVSAGLCVKEVKNMRDRGYYHLYSCNDIKTIRRNTKLKVEEVQNSLERILKQFEDDLTDITSSRSLRILIAEDEHDISLSYKIALEKRGHEVVLTRDGEECLKIYRESHDQAKISTRASSLRVFDVVILDYSMPKMNGMEVAKGILARNPRQRIIFASAYVKNTLMHSIKELGQVVELMQKPFDAKALVETVEDREVQDSLRRLMMNLNHIDISNPESNELRELFGALRLIQKARTF